MGAGILDRELGLAIVLFSMVLLSLVVWSVACIVLHFVFACSRVLSCSRPKSGSTVRHIFLVSLCSPIYGGVGGKHCKVAARGCQEWVGAFLCVVFCLVHLSPYSVAARGASSTVKDRRQDWVFSFL